MKSGMSQSISQCHSFRCNRLLGIVVVFGVVLSIFQRACGSLVRDKSIFLWVGLFPAGYVGFLSGL